MIDDRKLNKSQKAIVEAWRLACIECEKVTNQLLKLKWYEAFIPGRFGKILKRLEIAHLKWDLHFELMKRSGVFDL